MKTKDRLKEFLAYLKIGQNSFEKKVGISNGYINNFKGNIGSDIAAKICQVYPDLNLHWLLAGEGEMLKSESVIQQGNNNINVSGNHNANIGNTKSSIRYGATAPKANTDDEVAGVPYYDVDFIGGFDEALNDQTLNPTYYIHFPQYAKAERWVNVTGHSMEPLINHGDIIAMKRLEDWETYLLYGEVYAIVTDEYRTIKYVRKSAKGEEYLRLIPANSGFDEQDIPKSVVRAVFQILGCAKRIF